MSRRSTRDLVELAIDDLRHSGGRRIRNAIGWRSRKLRDRLARWFRLPVEPVVYPVAFGPNGERTLDALRTHARTCQRAVDVRRLAELVVTDHPRRRSIRSVRSAVYSGPSAWTRTSTSGRRPPATTPLSRRAADRHARLAKSFELLVVERRIGKSPPHVQCSRIEVTVWAPGTDPYSTPFFQSDREFAIVGRLSPGLKSELVSAHHDFDNDFPAPDQPDFPIDVVYTWVDGDDPAWLARRAAVQPEWSPPGNPCRPRRTVPESRRTEVLAALTRPVRAMDSDDPHRDRRPAPSSGSTRHTRRSIWSRTGTSTATRRGCRRSTRAASRRSCITSPASPSDSSTSTTTSCSDSWPTRATSSSPMAS